MIRGGYYKMTFTYSSGTITQTGTDTSLSGLSGLTGVVNWTDGIKDYYRIDDSSVTKLNINGTLTYDPDLEHLILDPNTQVTQSGDFQYGVVKTVGIDTSAKSRTCGLTILMDQQRVNLTAAAWQVLNGASFTTRGGIIETAGNIFFGSDVTTPSNNSITIDIDGTHFINLNDETESSHTLRIFAAPAGIDIQNITMDGVDGAMLVFSSLGFNTLSAKVNNANFACDGNGPKDPVQVDNPEFALNASQYDYTAITLSNASALTNINKYIFQNSDIGSDISTYASQGYALNEIRKDLVINTLDINGDAIEGAKVYSGYLGATANTVSTRYSGANYDVVVVYTGTSAASGAVSSIDVLYAVTIGNTSTPGAVSAQSLCSGSNDVHPWQFFSYNELPANFNIPMRGTEESSFDFNLLPDSNITESTKTTVDAYTTHDDAYEAYDGAKALLYDSFAGETQLYIGRASSQLDFDSGSATAITIDSAAASSISYATTTLTLRSTTFTGGATGTGTVTTTNGTLLNGGIFDCDISYDSGASTTITNVTCNGTMDFTTAGTYTISGGSIANVTSSVAGVILNSIGGAVISANGSPANITINDVKEISISNITANSRIRLYNVTTDTVITNEIVSGTSFSDTYNEGEDYTVGDTVRMTLTYVNGTSAKICYTANTIVTSNGFSFLAAQQDDAIYNANGIDGSLVSECTADFPNVEVDIDDGDGATTVKRIYAFFVAEQYTASGIQWCSGISAEDSVNYKINTSILDLRIQNVGTNAVVLTGGRLFRDDGATIFIAGNGPIQHDPDKAYLADSEQINKNILNTQALVISKNN